ncbi:MAG: hypothetical protein ACTSPL_08425, partial [Candidatus Odinarchaeia archaeon]
MRKENAEHCSKTQEQAEKYFAELFNPKLISVFNKMIAKKRAKEKKKDMSTLYVSFKELSEALNKELEETHQLCKQIALSFEVFKIFKEKTSQPRNNEVGLGFEDLSEFKI